MSVVAVVGSAFQAPVLCGRALLPHHLKTAWGPVVLHRHPEREDAWLLFRHGLPHRWLPHQVPWRAHAAALAEVGCEALLLTSAVGLLDPSLPLGRPLLVADLLWPDNLLPDGTPCTMFPEPVPGQGHLVLEEGLFSRALSDQVAALAPVAAQGPPPRVIFAFVGGPRTKTAAENRFWAAAGAQVNSMSVGPEAVLANELGVPVAALVVGHKRSGGRAQEPGGQDHGAEDHGAEDHGAEDHGAEDHGAEDHGAAAIDASLHDARQAMEAAVDAFLCQARPVPFGNHLHRM